MSIPMDTYCMQCYLRRNIDLARTLGSEAEAADFARDIMRLLLDAPKDAPSPYLGPEVADLLLARYGLEIDRYRQEKIDSNRFVLAHMEEIRSRVRQAEDPLYAGLQYAILGNYLDFSALQGQVEFGTLEAMLDKGEEMALDKDCFREFCRELETGKELLYLTDNAGEIGFDRIFAEEIARRYPHLTITFCVRGDIAANDATREDAAVVGLSFPVIDNGNRVAGTVPELLGEEARQAMERADVILAKGMGNAETLYGCGKNIYYAFLVKCQRFVTLFQKPLMTPMFLKEK